MGLVRRHRLTFQIPWKATIRKKWEFEALTNVEPTHMLKEILVEVNQPPFIILFFFFFE